MTDVVERLRRATGGASDTALCAEAATEIESLRARLSQAGAGGVVVRPLEWEDKPGVRFADTRIGTYWAFADGTLKLDSVQLSFDRSRHWSETQAAAQADYEARILAALAPSPSAGKEEPVGYARREDIGAITELDEVLIWGKEFPGSVALYAHPARRKGERND